MAVLLSIQVGTPQARDLALAPAMQDSVGRVWTSAIFKDAVTAPVWLGKLNLVGDAQSDLKNHGGPDKAVLMYAAAHYDDWRRTLPHIAWTHGGFGENFTVSDMDEDSVCLGDVYAVGDGPVRIEVSQPRVPCWKLARRWQQKDLAARVRANGHSGWYVRVLEEGEVAPGMTLTLLDRPYPQWSIRQVQYVVDNSDEEVILAAELAACPALSEGWRNELST